MKEKVIDKLDGERTRPEKGYEYTIHEKGPDGEPIEDHQSFYFKTDARTPQDVAIAAANNFYEEVESGNWLHETENFYLRLFDADGRRLGKFEMVIDVRPVFDVYIAED